jgi:outer membrane protein OmpA-like peptidoglycan-associated protein
MRTITRTIAVLAVAAACGCARRPNMALDQARAAYQEAQQSPEVTAEAPVALHEARQALDDAERAYDKDRDQKDVNTLAYVAQQKVKIARQVAREKQADDVSRRLAEQRNEVVANARTGEARLERERARALADELQELRAKETERGTVITLGDVLFETNKAELKPGAMRDLGRLVDVLRRDANRRVVIEGHTDDTGAADYNRRLSQERADAVRDYLVSQGISPDRIVSRGLGESYPVATNGTAAGRQQNRRVEVILPPTTSATAGYGRRRESTPARTRAVED